MSGLFEMNFKIKSKRTLKSNSVVQGLNDEVLGVDEVGRCNSVLDAFNV